MFCFRTIKYQKSTTGIPNYEVCIVVLLEKPASSDTKIKKKKCPKQF